MNLTPAMKPAFWARLNPVNAYRRMIKENIQSKYHIELIVLLSDRHERASFVERPCSEELQSDA